uniref:Uncharacterized protein n=1 Tax=Anguilla anguilla TaxID=7936 RepID=A0A0E9WHK8_ANGAN
MKCVRGQSWPKSRTHPPQPQHLIPVPPRFHPVCFPACLLLCNPWLIFFFFLSLMPKYY